MTSVVISLLLLGVSCKSTRTEIIYAEVEKGNQLDKIPELGLHTFLTIWAQKTEDEKGLTVRQVYKDSTFSYFWVRWNRYYKVSNESLSLVDYKSINGDSIRANFYNQIIPEHHKERQNQCSTALIDIRFEYDFPEQNNLILIKCHYKVKCELQIRVINKDYEAMYDIASRDLILI